LSFEFRYQLRQRQTSFHNWATLAILKGSEFNMKKPRQKGFALVLVITAMAIIGLEMHVLTSGANTMLFQADTAYLEACKRNLITSGLAWAKRNIRNNNRDTFEKTVELDVSKMPGNAGFRLKPAVGGIRGSSLIVTISIPTDEEPQAQINVSCSRGRRTFRDDGKHKIRL
jgi:hypothetical protein